jgi:hypothetical protein
MERNIWTILATESLNDESRTEKSGASRRDPMQKHGDDVT